MLFSVEIFVNFLKKQRPDLPVFFYIIVYKGLFLAEQALTLENIRS